MTAAAIDKPPVMNGHIEEMSPLERTRRRWTLGFIFSTVLGFGSTMGGLGLSALALFGMMARGALRSAAGTWLVVASFPLLVLGAHSLHKAYEARKAIRREWCEQHGVEKSKC